MGAWAANCGFGARSSSYCSFFHNHPSSQKGGFGHVLDLLGRLPEVTLNVILELCVALCSDQEQEVFKGLWSILDQRLVELGLYG